MYDFSMSIAEVIKRVKERTKRNGNQTIGSEFFLSEMLEIEGGIFQFLMNEYDVKKEEVIAIGDNVNDKKMVENAGLGIAMGGSTPNLTSVADFITKTSDEDGVAYALNKFLN